MEATQEHSQGTRRKVWQKGLGFIWEVIQITGRHLWNIIIIFIVFFGLLEIYDVFVPEKIPKINTGLTGEIRRQQWDRTGFNEASVNFNEKTGWAAFQPALKILDQVCPEASTWVRDRHAKGKIIWETEDDNTYAKYNYMSQTLYINRNLIYENNMERSVTLAHECRHSRQNGTKGVRLALVMLLTGQRRSEYVEDDAYLFEHEVRNAIHGWYVSSATQCSH